MATRSASPQYPATQRQQLLAKLLARDGSLLRNQARRNAPSAVDAEDALQDACIAFLRYFGASPEAALPWMMVVIRHCAWKIGERRRRREAPIAPSPTDAFDPSGQLFALLDERPGPAEQLELTGRIELLDALKPDERTALVLCAIGYSYREIAERQGWTYTKVNRCISEGRAALREMVARGTKPSR